MTQDDMVKVARECGIGLAYGRESIERFYTFVAAAEREACAKVCDEKYEAVPKSDPYAEADGDYSELIYAGAAQDCAAAIRARGDT